MEFTKDIKFNNNPTENQETTITYSGFLNNSSELTIVYGFGDNWENTTETKMEKTEEGFVASIKMPHFDKFNFCFRNSNYAWDNNCNCNYISQIIPTENFEDIAETSGTEKVEPFELCTLIDDILESIVKEEPITENIEKAEIIEEPIDLGQEITRVLSEINYEDTQLTEYSSIDEILTSTVINEAHIDIPTEANVDNIVDELIQNTQNFSNTEEEIKESTQPETEQALVTTEDPFIISSRQVSSFYLFKKRLKLILYKVFIKFPKYMLGFED